MSGFRKLGHIYQGQLYCYRDVGVTTGMDQNVIQTAEIVTNKP